MADKVTKGRTGLPNGLPRLLGEDPDKLNDLLGLTRQERLRIGTLVPKAVRARIDMNLKSRSEPVRPGERDRVVVQVHYQHRQVRQAAWHVALERGPGGKPSLEAVVLSEFIEAARGARATGDSDDDRTETEWIADRAWADTRDRLARWDALDAEEREQCVLRTFAVATLRDDAAILSEAIDLASDLTDQFESLLPGEAEKQGDPGSDPGEPASVRWTALIEALKKLATRAAGPPPNPALLHEIATVVESLRGVEPWLNDELSSEAFRGFLAEVRKRLDAIESDKTFRLDDERRTALEEQWERYRGALKGDELAKERRRFESAVSATVEHVRRAGQELADAKKRIESHRAEEPDDPFAQEDWGDVLEALQRDERTYRNRHRDAHDSLLTALSPRGEGFDAPARAAPPEPTLPKAAPPEPTLPKAAPPKPTPPKAAPPKPTPPKAAPPKPTPPKAVTPRPTPPKAVTPRPTPPKAAPPKPTPPRAAPPRKRSPDPLTVKAEQVITAALMEKPPRLAYAVQTSRLCERAFPDEGPARSRPLEAALLSSRLRTPDGTVAMRLRDVLTDLTASEPDWSDEDTAFQATVRFAACLRPALFAPITTAFSVLNNLPRCDRYPALYDLGHRVANHAVRLQGARVDASFLHTLRSQAQLDAEREECRKAIAAWARNAPRRTMPYAPATALWQRWAKPGGEIGQVMANLDATAVNGVPMQRVVSQWSDRNWIVKRVASTDRKMRGSLHSGAGIRFRALDRIVLEARKAGQLAQSYLDISAAPSDASDYRVQVLSQLRGDLKRLAPATRDQLLSDSGSPDPWVSAGARLAARAIGDLQVALDPQPDTGERDNEPDPNDLLAAGFFVTRVLLDRDGQPVGEPRDVLVTAIEEPPLAPQDAVRAHLESGDLFAAQRILNWMEVEEQRDPGELRSALNAKADRHREKLGVRLRSLRADVENGLMLGSVSADERERHESVVVEVEHQLKDPASLHFRELDEKLKGIESELETSERQHLEKVNTEFADLFLPAEGPQARAIKRAIEERDIVRANEWIQRVRDDPDLDVNDGHRRSRLDGFFPDAAKTISLALEEAGRPDDVVERIRGGKSFADLPQDLPGARRDSAARMLEAWFALKRRGELGPDGARRIAKLFSEIGFRVRSVDARRSSTDAVVLDTVPLDRRDQCPVPAYGSSADGSYRIVCIWNRPTVDDLLRYGDQPGAGPPAIILYFGRLSERQRTELALAARERAQTILVLDEVALVFLCGERDSRLPVLFGCTLPFSYVQPYSARGGAAAPEMFYGRDAELARVTSRNDSCFVYGGRQIGKTAILRAVRDRHHRPAEGHYVFFVDLKAREIGVGGGIAEIWSLLWRMLTDGGAIPKDTREPSTRSRGRIEEFLDALIRHFAPGSGRTLLLLLDEADHFLEMDAREQQAGVAATGYRESIRLRRLMEETRRSIKVVFAGLHNVLRTVEQANHPLGQFGRPVQVRPLLRNGGERAARDLVIQPLRAAGYLFEPEDLVTRILGQTNYYPGLIQAYCAELIGAMLSRCNGPPPFTLTPEVIEKAYREGGLRQFIRGRFHLTLELDKRYEVIAYSVAWLCLGEENALVTGFPGRRIYEEAITWWPAGFADLSGEEFASLLDEMVGLGVLRESESEEGPKHSLRNPNVLLLMGTQEQIEQKLEEEREPPEGLEPRILRARRKPDDPDDPHRSPLTFRQQSRLFAEENGVVLISGVPAAGLNDVLDTFRSQPDRPLVQLKGVEDRALFAPALRGGVKSQEAGIRVYGLPEKARWTAEWVRDAQSYLKALRKSDRHVRVVFLASGDRLPGLLHDPGVRRLARLEKIFLEPWRDGFLRQWMQDVSIGDAAGLRRRILNMTGGWPDVLMRIPELIEVHGSTDAALDELDMELADAEQQRHWRHQLCLDNPVTRDVLRPLAIYGELSRNDVLEEVSGDGLDLDEADVRLRAAGHLGLARHGLAWSLNPLVARLLGEEG
ncbi:MAG: ATP-binding protein [Acidobacteria bacterium]|nr:ATP-binding protein [Acidobacteriota bacterium]